MVKNHYRIHSLLYFVVSPERNYMLHSVSEKHMHKEENKNDNIGVRYCVTLQFDEHNIHSKI